MMIQGAIVVDQLFNHKGNDMITKKVSDASIKRQLQKINIIQWNRIMSRFRQIRKFVHRKFKELRQ